MMGPVFRQLQLESEEKSGSLLVSKKGKATIHVRKKTTPSKAGGKAGADLSGEALRQAWQQGISHNRKKNYILEEGIPVPFLVELGVQTADGQVVHAKYDKFRQINRFLEFIEDVLPKLDRDRESVILDFGCGKSYLTFAMYYYLKELKGYPVRIIGLDLKADVIRRCSELRFAAGTTLCLFQQAILLPMREWNGWIWWLRSMPAIRRRIMRWRRRSAGARR